MVIAILAAITVVAYNGIQQRADMSSLESAISQAKKQIELFKVQNDTYPVSVNDCPTPAGGNMCLTKSSNITYRYTRMPMVQTSLMPDEAPSYGISVESERAFIYESPFEAFRTGSNAQFLQYMDMKPIIDKYGLKAYKYEFDIKSLNTAPYGTLQMYFQNGSGSRYSMNHQVPITFNEYRRESVVSTPTSWLTTEPGSYLAFYGMSYGNGHIPAVKNMRITLAN